MKRSLIFLIFLLAVSCTVRPPLTPEAARGSLVALVNDTPFDSMRAGGNVAFSQNGEQASVSFDITWAGDSAFSAQFSTAFGMTVASVTADGPGKWIVAAADSRSTVSPDSAVVIGQDFLRYPLTWKEFISVLTGRVPCAFVFSQEPDTGYIDKKSIRLEWRSRRYGGRSVDISGIIDNKTQCLSEVQYIGKLDGGWTLSLAGFTHGHAKEFRFVQSNNNYFYVKYHSVKFYSAAAKRKAFRS